MSSMSPEAIDALNKFSNAVNSGVVSEEAWEAMEDLAKAFEKMRKHWEEQDETQYERLEEGFDDVQGTIDEYESEGWELVDQYVTIGEGIEMSSIHLFFKRKRGANE